MAAAGEAQEDGDGGSSSDSSASNSPPARCLPSMAVRPSASPLALCPPAALSVPSHLSRHQQQRLLSLHLSPAATPLHAQARPLQNASSDPCPIFNADRPFRDDCWSENATFALIEAWGERHIKLNRANFRRRHWQDIADCVNSRSFCSSKLAKTDVQCKNRLDTLKKKYKIEKSKLVTGGTRSKWAFFDRLDGFIGSFQKTTDQSPGKVSRCAAALPDGDGLNHSNGQVTVPFARCTAEDDLKPPLFFFPPQATIAVNPPPLTHHIGGVVLQMRHPDPASKELHLNSQARAPIFQHLAAVDAPVSHLAGMGPHHLLERVEGASAVSHQVGDGGGSVAAADTASKSKVDPIFQGSLPHTRSLSKRRLKRRRGRHRPRKNGPYRELAMAIGKLGDVYERIEIAKLEQATALEKRRRELIKDLEIQRMQTFAKLQIELAKTKYGGNLHSNAEDQ